MLRHIYDKLKKPPLGPATAAVVLIVVCGLTTYGVRKSAARHERDGEAGAESAARLVSINGGSGLEMGSESLKLAGVTTVSVVEQDLEQQVTPTGEVAATDNGTVQVISRLPGRITQTFVAVGGRVHKGQIIAWVDSVDLAQAEAAYQTAFAHQRLTYNQLQQQRKLAQYGVLSEPAIEDARKTFAAAVSSVAIDESQINIDRTALNNTRKLVNMGEITEKPVEDAQNAQAQTQSALIQAQVALESAKANLHRAKTLYDGGVYSKQQLQDAQTAFDTSSAALTQSETQEKLTASELKRQQNIYKQDLNGNSSLQQTQSKLRQDQHAYQSDLTALELARKELARAQAVRKSGIPVSQSLQQAQDANEEAMTAIQGAATTLRIYGITPSQGMAGLNNGHVIVPVVSPIEGIVTERHMTVGQLTDTSTPLVKIVNLDKVYVDASIYEKDLTSVKAGDPIQVRVEAFPQRVFTGDVECVGDKVNTDTRTIRVRTVIPNSGWLLRPGMFATVLIGDRTGKRNLAIPTDAVMQEGAHQFVYVQVSARDFIQREVKVGAPVGDKVRVLSGLSVGEKIVVNGNVLMQQEQKQLEEDGRSVMIDRFIEGMLRQRFVAVAIALLIVAGGIMALRSLNIDAFPDITPVRVEVDTDCPGLASEEVEKLVTHPLEVGLQGIPNATHIQSTSKFGISVVTVYFEDKTDVYWARDQVFQQLGSVDMPPGITWGMGPNDTGTGQIFIYALKSPVRSNMELRTLQDWVVTPALKAVPGVADNLSFGGEAKQYQVLMDPDKLRAYGLGIDDVINAISKNNQNAGGYFLRHGASR